MSSNGSDPGAAVAIEVPQFGIIVQDDAFGTPYIGVQVMTSGTLSQYFLCMVDDSEATARKWHQQILQAGKEGRKRQGKTTLTIPTGGDINAIRKAQGRK